MFRKSGQGAQLFAISPELPEHSRKLIEKLKLNFEILHDPQNEYAHQLDLVHGLEDELRTVYSQFGIDLDQANGATGWNLPMPARIVVEPGYRIKSFEFGARYTERPEPDETLAILNAS